MGNLADFEYIHNFRFVLLRIVCSTLKGELSVQLFLVGAFFFSFFGGAAFFFCQFLRTVTSLPVMTIQALFPNPVFTVG